MRKISFPVTIFALAALFLSGCSVAVTSVAPTQGGGVVPNTGDQTTATPFVSQTATVGSTDTVSTTTGTPASSTPVSGTQNNSNDNNTGIPTNDPPGSTNSNDANPTPGVPANGANNQNSINIPGQSATVASSGNNSGSSGSGGGGGIGFGATPIASPTPDENALPSTPGDTTYQTGQDSSGTNTNGTGATDAAGRAVPLVRLSDVFKMSVGGSDQTSLGTVSGVVLDRPEVSASTSGSNAQVNVQSSFIRYIVVKGQNSEVLVPWQVFNFDEANANAQNGILSLSTLNLTSGAQAFNAAPAFDRSNASNFTSQGWDAGITSYWASQGLTIPATGSPASARNEIFIDKTQLSQLNLSGADNQVFGQVADFMVNPQNGEIVYAIINGGATLGDRAFMIPLTNLNWQGSTGVDLGRLVAGFPNTAFDAAPFLDMTNGIIQLPQDWSTQIQNFWNGINP